MIKSLSAGTLIPISAAIAAIGLTIPIVRAIDAPSAELATLRERVVSVESRVEEIRSRQDRADDRWLQVLDDLSKIKERLGIVESRPK